MLSWAQRQRTADQQRALTMLQPCRTQLSPILHTGTKLLQAMAGSILLVSCPQDVRHAHCAASTHKCLQHAELGAMPEDC